MAPEWPWNDLRSSQSVAASSAAPHRPSPRSPAAARCAAWASRARRTAAKRFGETGEIHNITVVGWLDPTQLEKYESKWKKTSPK